jgi:hypothetical protein
MLETEMQSLHSVQTLAFFLGSMIAQLLEKEIKEGTQMPG